ncbi:MAG: hypothetical protein ISR68_00060 [Campylobacterales bacterium]|nr:hypothetical protein [Campylobacterales bacterium]
MLASNMHMIVFLHVISAVIWVGGMIAIRFAVHYATPMIEEPKVKLGVTLEILRRFFKIVSVALMVIILTAVAMSVGFGLNTSELSSISHSKELIYVVMTLLFISIVKKRNKAQELFNEGKLLECKKQLLPISGYLIPINITLGIVALYLGIVLRGL